MGRREWRGGRDGAQTGGAAMMGGDVEQVELTERVAGGEGEGEAASARATAASAEATEGAAAGGGGAAEQPHADGAATPVLTRVGRSVLSWLEYAGDHLADVFGLNDSKVREASARARARARTAGHAAPAA